MSERYSPQPNVQTEELPPKEPTEELPPKEPKEIASDALRFMVVAALDPTFFIRKTTIAAVQPETIVRQTPEEIEQDRRIAA